MARGPLRFLPSRRLALALLSALLVFPLLFGFLRQRYYAHGKNRFLYTPANRFHEPLSSVKSISQNTFDHSTFFYARRNNDSSSNYCDLVSQGQIADLVDSLERPVNVTKASAFHFRNGSLVTASNNQFSVGSGFCTVFLAPQGPWQPNSDYQNVPMDGMGPDQIHAEIGSPDVRLMLTWHPEYWGTVDTAGGWWRRKVPVAVYAAAYSLYHPGAYQVKAEIEYQNYDWEMEDSTDFRFIDHKYEMSEVHVKARSPPITVTGSPVSRPTEPCYRRGLDDLSGRWYRATSFNDYGNQTALNHGASLSWASQFGTVDGWGWTFAPDKCSLDFFSAKDTLSCFKNSTMHVVGDSNSRRMLKSLISGGEHWCPGEDLKDQWCTCEDYMQGEVLDAAWQQFDLAKLQDQAQHKLEPMTWGHGSKVFFDMVGGIVNAVLFNGWSFYYSGRPHANVSSSDQPLSIMAQRQLDHGPADVVYMSLVTWDTSALRTPAETLAFLPEFREKVFSTYRKGTRFVFRLGNAVCCGNTNHRTRFSVGRFMMWNTLWREFFADDVKAGRVMFVDGSNFQGRRETEMEGGCATSHLRVSHVRMEQQMFMNTLCEKTVNGTTRMRQWRWGKGIGAWEF